MKLNKEFQNAYQDTLHGIGYSRRGSTGFIRINEVQPSVGWICIDRLVRTGPGVCAFDILYRLQSLCYRIDWEYFLQSGESLYSLYCAYSLNAEQEAQADDRVLLQEYQIMLFELKSAEFVL